MCQQDVLYCKIFFVIAASVLDKFHIPPQLADATLEKHAIFKIPIIIVAGMIQKV